MEQQQPPLWKPIVIVVAFILVLFSIILILHHHTNKPSSPIAKHLQHSKWRAVRINHGDSIDRIFARLSIKHHIITMILEEPTAKRYLTQLKAGQTIYFKFKERNLGSLLPRQRRWGFQRGEHDLPFGRRRAGFPRRRNINGKQSRSLAAELLNKQKQLVAIKYPVSDIATLFINKTKQGFSTELIDKPVTSKILYKQGQVTISILQTARDIKLPLSIYAQFVSVFQGTVNFSRDLRPGDHFNVLYREYYLNGKPLKTGHLIVAALTDQHHTHYAIRYTYPIDHSGYYTPNGNGVEPLFMRFPLHYKFISSRFSYHRLDPITHHWQPHLGVDLAANIGTAVRAIGDGEIIFCGRDDGYGNAIKIRYDHRYETLYAHLKRFAKHMHDNKYVHKGEVVGYVGDTGWSTGPHLHFGFFINDHAVNPLTVHFPGGHSVPRSYLAKFRDYAKSMLKKLSADERHNS